MKKKRKKIKLVTLNKKEAVNKRKIMERDKILPHNTPLRHLLGSNIATLLHEGTDREPERVEQREAVLQKQGLAVAGVWIFPLVRCEAAAAKQDAHGREGDGSDRRAKAMEGGWRTEERQQWFHSAGTESK